MRHFGERRQLPANLGDPIIKPPLGRAATQLMRNRDDDRVWHRCHPDQICMSTGDGKLGNGRPSPRNSASTEQFIMTETGGSSVAGAIPLRNRGSQQWKSTNCTRGSAQVFPEQKSVRPPSNSGSAQQIGWAAWRQPLGIWPTTSTESFRKRHATFRTRRPGSSISPTFSATPTSMISPHWPPIWAATNPPRSWPGSCRAHAALQPADCLILLPQPPPAAVETSIAPSHYPAECTRRVRSTEPARPSRARKF